MSERVRVLIIHPNRLFREALAFCVKSHRESLALTGCIGDVGILLRDQPTLLPPPDVIIWGGRPSAQGGLEGMSRLRERCFHAKIVALGMSEDEPQSPMQALPEIRRSDTIVLREVSLEALLLSVQALASCNDMSTFSTGDSEQVHGAMGNASAGKPDWVPSLFSLTHRERQVLVFLQNGIGNKEIAVKLEIAVQTVKNHVHRIFEKLGFRERREVVRYTAENSEPFELTSELPIEAFQSATDTV